jgi:hypothetical protein
MLLPYLFAIFRQDSMLYILKISLNPNLPNPRDIILYETHQDALYPKFTPTLFSCGYQQHEIFTAITFCHRKKSDTFAHLVILL